MAQNGASGYAQNVDADTNLEALAARLGPDSFRRRVVIERRLTLLRRFVASPRTLVAKWLLSAAAINASTRACGLYQRGYRQFLEPRLVEHETLLPKLPPALDGVALLHFSDLHADLDADLISGVLARIAGVAYDLAVFTGDFRNHMTGPHEAAVAAMRQLLAHVRAPAFAVLGNHDTLAMVPPLEAAGLRFLLNEHVVWTRGDAALVLAGVDDSRFFGAHDLARALAGAPPRAPRVLLAHAPSLYRAAAAHGVDLMLAGHTHGGQICLPGGFMVLTGEKCRRRYLRGAWRYGALRGYTSSGTGASGVPLRFNCPGEITRHVLRRAPSA
jgi:predicted MPP superfamily phosphohydrolase